MFPPEHKTTLVVNHWHSLPRDIAESPSVDMLKTKRDMVLGNLPALIDPKRVGLDDLKWSLPN